MVAVENYLKNHFGRISPTCKIGDKNQNISRVPLVPTDIDIASMTSSPLAEESTTLGNKLHNMVNSKITTNVLASTSSSKCKRHFSEIEKDEKLESVKHLSKCFTTTTSTSDHPVDIFEDKNIITAVACVSKEDHNYKKEKKHNVDMISHEVQEFKLCNDVQHLENALYRRLSNGTFQKRLRMKNLTLTPKQSMQHVFVLQSGDTKSLIVKSTLSQKLTFCEADKNSKFNTLPVMPRNVVKFSLPMQVATVGYVFPTYHRFKNSLDNQKNSLDNKDFENNLHIITSANNEWVDKTAQCYKVNIERQSLKQNTDTKGTVLFNMNTVFSKATSVSPKETIEQSLKIPSTQEIIVSEDLRNVVCKPENKVIKNSENISDSTSLDILVGLLNEIKKITTCQTNLVSPVNETDTCIESKELKVILNNSNVQDNSANHSIKYSVSNFSIDNQIHRQPSNFSLRLRSSIEDYVGKLKLTKDQTTNYSMNYIEPSFSDKEINLKNISEDFVHKCTDVPSRFFPVTVNRSTDVIRSLIALVNQTSNEPYSDCHVLYSNSTFNNINIIQRLNKRKCHTSSKPDINKLQENVTKVNTIKDILNVSGVKIKPKDNLTLEKNILNRDNFNNLQEYDSSIKIKRDILVTVYSILVFTVFAALTLPEIIFPV